MDIAILSFIFKKKNIFIVGAGAQSYTATVLHAAQTLGRGLRGLSETVASSLTGPRNHTGGQMGVLGSSPPTMNGTDHSSPGIVTVLDLEVNIIEFLNVEILVGSRQNVLVWSPDHAFLKIS